MEEDKNSGWLEDPNYVVISVASSVMFVAFSIFLATVVFKSYLGALFIITPFLSGVISSLIISYNLENKQKNTLGYSVKFSLLALVLSFILVIVVALEGAICVLMASPLFIGLNTIGAIIGYYVAQHLKERRKLSVLFTIIILNPAFISAESLSQTTVKTLITKSEIVVDAPANVVWQNLITKNTYSGFDNFFFQAGVAYPNSTVLVQKGADHYFVCNYSQGNIELPVRSLIENEKFEFGFEDTPAPMKELSFYNDLHLPHLHGYFKISSGQILLKQLNENQTLLTAKTTYSYNIKPLQYWKIWTNFLLNKIHNQVINTIKSKSENSSNAAIATQ
ncbi:MAG: hypothetical protein LPJ89_10620 [Hymenobacteraceae bacterium]|nr:hypothetical protein [Hymenobacteraceae bacterium]